MPHHDSHVGHDFFIGSLETSASGECSVLATQPHFSGVPGWWCGSVACAAHWRARQELPGPHLWWEPCRVPKRKRHRSCDVHHEYAM